MGSAKRPNMISSSAAGLVRVVVDAPTLPHTCRPLTAAGGQPTASSFAVMTDSQKKETASLPVELPTIFEGLFGVPLPLMKASLYGRLILCTATPAPKPV